MVPAADSGTPSMKIGPYETRNELGRGIHGVTYLAVHEESGRRVALKWLYGELPEKPEERPSRFDATARVLAGLNHPAIVDILAVGISGRTCVVVSEMVDGLDLATLYARGEKFPPDEVMSLAKQVAIALDYAHNYDVVHGNICPRNIFWTPRQSVKVCDFGMASLAAFLDGGGRAAASSPYMAPEVLYEDRPPSAQSDLYSLAAVLYELLTGVVPYGGTGGATHEGRFKFLELESIRPETGRARELVPPRELNNACPLHLEKAIVAALQQDPARRPRNIKCFRDILAGHLEASAPGKVAAPSRPFPSVHPSQTARRPLNLCPGCGWPLHPASRLCLVCGRGFALPSAESVTDAHERLGDRLLGQAEFADAQKAYNRARQTGKARPDAVVGLARAQAGLHRYAQACRLYRRLVASRPTDELLQLELAQVLLAMRKESDARRYLEPLSQGAERPEVADSARMLLAELEARNGNHMGAVRLYKQVLADDPKVALAHCGLGESLAAVHDTAGAVAEFEAALSIEPGLQRAKRGIARALEIDRHRTALDPLALVVEGLTMGGGGLSWLLEKLGGTGRRR